MESIKVSFIGDIMCEKPFMAAARKNDGSYDFERAFKGLKALFEKSNCLVGNFETVCAGEDRRYTHELYSFNTPDSFVEALRICGITVVSTANNHCLDRGLEGLRRTLDVLDDAGISHTGTYRNIEEASKPCVIDIDGLRLGLVSYTYGTNPNMNGVILAEEDSYSVNLIQPQKYTSDKSLYARLRNLISIETKTKIKKAFGKPYKNITVDCVPTNLNWGYLNRFASDLRETKIKSDYTVCLLHCGGQFNREPGPYSEYLMNKVLQQGIDSVIGNHPHNVQKSKLLDNGIATFCLGNVSISPSSIYVPMENHPDYSVMVNLYFSKTSKKLEKMTASVLNIDEEDDHYLIIRPAYDCFQETDSIRKKEIAQNTKDVLETFLTYEINTFNMQEEWEIWRCN